MVPLGILYQIRWIIIFLTFERLFPSLFSGWKWIKCNHFCYYQEQHNYSPSISYTHEYAYTTTFLAKWKKCEKTNFCLQKILNISLAGIHKDIFSFFSWIPLTTEIDSLNSLQRTGFGKAAELACLIIMHTYRMRTCIYTYNEVPSLWKAAGGISSILLRPTQPSTENSCLSCQEARKRASPAGGAKPPAARSAN